MPTRISSFVISSFGGYDIRLFRRQDACVILLPIAIHQGHARSLRTHWKRILTFAAIEMCIPFGALGAAEKEISSSLTGLPIATVPLIYAVISRQLGLDSVWDAQRIVGLLDLNAKQVHLEYDIARDSRPLHPIRKFLQP